MGDRPDDSSRMAAWFSPLVFLSSNWISLVGVVVVTTAAVTGMFAMPSLLRSSDGNPYLGLFGFVALPTLFIVGLVLIPLGIAFQRRRLKKRGVTRESYPRMSLASPEFRRIAGFVLATTVVNLGLAGQFTYSAVNYVDSSSFCGNACHSVMSPEYTAYQYGAHAHVECIRCHAGPGALGFIDAKLAGVKRLVAVATGSYQRPIPPENPVPASETCEECHSLNSQPEDRLLSFSHFADDEMNTPSETVLVMYITKIHQAHMDGAASQPKIRFAEDADGKIVAVVKANADGAPTVFSADGKGEAPANTQVMDCKECHNRPAHEFQLAESAVDKAMLAGTISPKWPFAKQQSVEVLKADYPGREEAIARIPEAFGAYYQKNYPDVYSASQAELANAGQALGAMYAHNIFPGMKVTWGTYPSNLGHTQSTGCFRCHNYDLSSSAGDVIGQDCSTCHNLVAMEEESPTVLTDLGADDFQ